MKEKLKQLLLNFHSPGRRYSYYPSLPKWEHSLSKEEILASSKSKEIDLYIHIPFCENLCTFCGCNIKVTKERNQFKKYINQVLKEWNFYKERIEGLTLNSVYLGGGTPTILSSLELKELLSPIIDKTPRTKDFAGTVETDPRIEQKEQLRVLKNFGFNAISIGIQDTNEKVLHNVNRIQSIDEIKRTLDDANELGFTQTSIDLIYGLPFQTLESFQVTLEQVVKLNPTRVCNYPLARVPWQQGPQNAFGIYEPLSVDKMFDLYLEADEILQREGYSLLGMGHYSKSTKKHSRNIMGYTTVPTKSLLGLGVSAISNFDGNLYQNDKVLEKYLLDDTKIRISHKKSSLEAKLETIFLEITCLYRFDLGQVLELSEKKEQFLKTLTYLENNELIERDGEFYRITRPGKHFLRTICQTIENFVYN